MLDYYLLRSHMSRLALCYIHASIQMLRRLPSNNATPCMSKINIQHRQSRSNYIHKHSQHARCFPLAEVVIPSQRLKPAIQFFGTFRNSKREWW